MPIRLGRRIPVAVGATVLLAGSGGAAAFTLRAASGDSTTDIDSGNAQPIDDNHTVEPAVRTPAAGDDRGLDVRPATSRVPRAAPAPTTAGPTRGAERSGRAGSEDRGAQTGGPDAGHGGGR